MCEHFCVNGPAFERKVLLWIAIYHAEDRRKEIGPGLLKAMLDQLGLVRNDLEN